MNSGSAPARIASVCTRPAPGDCASTTSSLPRIFVFILVVSIVPVGLTDRRPPLTSARKPPAPSDETSARFTPMSGVLSTGSFSNGLLSGESFESGASRGAATAAASTFRRDGSAASFEWPSWAEVFCWLLGLQVAFLILKVAYSPTSAPRWRGPTMLVSFGSAPIPFRQEPF